MQYNLLDLVKRVVRSLQIYPLEYEEAIQIGLLGATKYLVENTTTSISTPQLVKYIKQEILNERQKLGTKSRRAVATVDIELMEIESNERDPYEILLEKELITTILNLSYPTEKHKQLVVLLLSGYTKKDYHILCKKLGVDTRTLKKIMEEVYDLVKEVLY